MRSKLWILVAAFLCGGSWTGMTAQKTGGLGDLFEDTVLARGKGFEIKSSELEQAFIAFRANLAARGQNMPEGQRAHREAQLLDRLIVTRIMQLRATEADREKATKLAEKFMAASKKEVASEEAFVRQLKALGMSLEQFEARVKEQALSEAVLDRELKSSVQIGDEQVKEFYETGTDELVRVMQQELERLRKLPDTTTNQLHAVREQVEKLRKANLGRLQEPEKVRVSHIYFATRNRDTEEELPEEQKQAKRKALDRLLTRAKSGADFGQMVQTYSEDQAMKETKGEYTFSRQDSFTPEFKSAAFALQPGQLSDIVTTPFGYHIIKLLERTPARKIPLEKVQGEIRDHLKEQAVQQRMPAYFVKVKKEAGVEVLDTKYRLSSPADLEAAPR